MRLLKKRKQRCYNAGPAFANIHKHVFRRFMPGGNEKVAIEQVYCCWRTIFEKRLSQISIKPCLPAGRQPEKAAINKFLNIKHKYLHHHNKIS